MHRQSGNFLLQALLALTLVFAFVPFLVSRMTARDMSAQMYSATRQAEVAQTAARIYVRENATKFLYGNTVLSGDAFSDTLEPYGLSLGFVPRTALGQDISLNISVADGVLTAYLELSGGNLSELKIAELARRIGFYAAPTGDGRILVGLDLDEGYSDIVRRNETDLDNSAFLNNLDLGENALENVGAIIGHNAEFDTAAFNTLSIVGVESGRKQKNAIENIFAQKSVFQSATGESALAISRGNLAVGSVDARTVSAFGDTGNFTGRAASVYDFSMTAGRTGFTGPSEWNVAGNVVTNNVNFSVERVDIKSFLNAARGQDVYINADTLEYSTRSGIETDYLIASNVTMRDQTSDALSDGQGGAVILDIRPAGTSILPDVTVGGINNDTFEIIKNVTKNDGESVDCKNIITDLEGRYNSSSLAQYIICQYVYWQRLERRIDTRQCIMDGRSDCI